MVEIADLAHNPLIFKVLHASRTAENVEDAKRLIEAEFSCVTDMNGYKLFGKRK